jgi:hypothetical protein
VPRNQFESNEPGPNDADKEFLGDRLYVPLPHLQDGHHYEIKDLPSGASAVVIEEGNAEPTEDEIVQQMHTHDSFGRMYAKDKRNDG